METVKNHKRIVSLVICSLLTSSAAFSTSVPLTKLNHESIDVCSHQKRQGQQHRLQTTRSNRDAFRLMNSYLDSLSSAAVDSPPGTNTQGVRSFHPQRRQPWQPSPKPNIGQDDVIETTATVVSPTESPAESSVPKQHVQSQYFPQPEQSMQPPPQQHAQSTSGASSTHPDPIQKPIDVQQSIPPNHETGHFNHPQATSSFTPDSRLPPIPPNVPIPQPPELQPPPTPENFDPHNPNFGTGTQQIYGQPPPMQQPPIQQPYPQGATSYYPPQGATSYYPSQGATSYYPSQGATSYYPQGNVAPPPYQPQQQPGTQSYQMYQPQPVAEYPNYGNVAQQMQQQQGAPLDQAQTPTQVFDPSTGSFPSQDLPTQGPPPSYYSNGQPISPQQQLQQQQQQQYGSFPQQNQNAVQQGAWGVPTTTQAQQMMQQPPQQQAPAQFDPHELMSQQRPNDDGRSWYDAQMRKPNRVFDTVHPWERDNNPQPLPPRTHQPPQPYFDPNSPSWDRQMSGTPAAASAVTTNLQGTSWHNDPNSWQGTQGLPYQDHPMNPLAAGMPVVAAPPPPFQAMNQSRRQPFDPHNPDWTRPLSSEIQGESRNTWHNHLGVPRVMVDLYSEGRPIDSEIELWQGPSNTPHKIKMYSEDGGIRPFKAVVETPGYGSSIDIKNSGPTAFPIRANVQPMLFRYEPERFKQVQGENSLYTVSLNDYATSALVTLETDGMPLMAQIELWQGPDNTPQKVRVYNEQGLPFQLMVETPGPQCTIAVRNIGPMEFPLYCAVSARVD